MDIEIKFSGQQELKKQLEQAIPDIMERVSAYYKQALPTHIEYETPIKSGALRGNNKVLSEVTDTGITVWLQNKMAYAKFIIEGTKHIRANDYATRGVMSFDAKVKYYMEDLVNNF